MSPWYPFYIVIVSEQTDEKETGEINIKKKENAKSRFTSH